MFIARRVASGAACLLAMLAAARADEPARSASAAAVSASKETSIASASTNIWNWQVIDDQTLLIESNSHQWYKAKLLSPCLDLPFAERIGFESNADGSFDKFSSIVARERTCHLMSLTQTSVPPRKGARKTAAEALKAN